MLLLAPLPLVPLMAAPAAHAAQACPPDEGFTDCLSFTPTGRDQDFTVPAGVSSLRAKAWGAGAAADADGRSGAAGAFATALLDVTPGQQLTVTPGAGGRARSDDPLSPAAGAARSGGASSVRSDESQAPGHTLLTADGGLAPSARGAAVASDGDVPAGLAPHVTERQYVAGAGFGGVAPSSTGAAGAGLPGDGRAAHAAPSVNPGDGGGAGRTADPGRTADAGKPDGRDGHDGLVVLEWHAPDAASAAAKAAPEQGSASPTPSATATPSPSAAPSAAPSAPSSPASPSVPATTPARRAPGLLDCSGRTIYAIQRGSSTAGTGTLLALSTGNVGGSTVTATTVSTLPAGSGFTNALGVTDGGTAAYVVDQTPTVNGSVNVYGYNATTGAWTVYTGSAGSTSDSFVAGAVDPANGIFYYASFASGTATTPGTATLYGFNTATNTAIPGVIATYSLPVTAAGGPNGDITFDAAGNLYTLSSVGTAAAIGRIVGPIPTTGSATGVPLTSTPLSTLSNPAGNSFNGAAFDNAGNLYIEFASGSTTYLEQLNPNTGAITAGPTPYSNNAFLSVDLGACSTNPTLALQKNIVGRFAESTSSNDQFNLAITGGGITRGNTATTTGTSTGVQSPPAGPVIALSNTVYTLTETAASGSLSHYTTTYNCVDTANGNAPVASGSGVTSFNLPFPPTVEDQNSPMVLCTFTNTPIPANPALTIVKSASPTTVSAVGQTVGYSFLVTNTGNVTLTNVTVNETAFSGTGTAPVISCPAGAASLAPGASVTCTASYAVTQADINAGSITNTATATGTPPSGPPVTSPPSTATVTATPSPALTIVKSASPTTVTASGQTVGYSFLVTNTGNVTLTNVTVNETAFSGTGTAPVVTCPAGAASLAPGASVTCTASYAVTQADINAGSITNTATATGTPPSGPPVTSPPSSATVTATPNPALTIVKSASPTTVTASGQTVGYSFLVTNTGNVTLTNVTVNETAFSGTGTAPVISCPAGAASLAPGASVTCTASYAVTQADINAGSITNTATATGTPPSGPPVTSPPSSATVTATPNPALTIVKSASPTTVTASGQTVAYSFLVTNTGNVTLTNVTVNETAFSGTGTAPVISCPAGAASLAPGASITCTASYAVTQADINAGSITNTATATGTPPSGPPVTSPPSSATVTATPNPALTIVKSASPTTVSAVGQTVDYSFLVTNTGNVTLTNVSVNETAFSGTGTPPAISCPAGAASLAPGASVTCTASYTVTQADIDAGTITNTATATGTPPSGPPVTSPPSSATVTATPNPALTIVKSASPTTVTASGQTVDYSFLVTNTGNVTLTNVTVNETAFSGTGTPPAISCPAGAASLAPGASITCTASYAVTQADIDAGTITNTATATGTPPSGPPVTSPPSSATVTATPNPALTIVKSASPTTVTASGQTVDYSFLVTNTGNVTLTNVTVNETAFSGTGTPPVVTCPAGAASLAPGASVTCTASYAVTQADIDAGTITNTATATGTPPSGPPVTSPPSSATVTATPNPALTIVKSASPTTVTASGQTVDYSYLVTNTGNVTLTNVSVNETAFSGTGTPPAISCPAGAASLAPGASITCTASYTVTQADIDAGTITNTATATGTPPSGPPVTSPPSTATVTATPNPALTIVKSASPTTVSAVGQTVDYSFLVTNTGNVTLTNVTVNETAFSGTGTAPVISCPAGAASLAPGASITCTASYAVTQADINAGSITNTATATGTPPSGPPVTSPPSSATVTATANPALTIVKSASPTTVTASGQTVDYSYLVTNTGNVTLTNVSVNETAFSGTGTPPVVTCPAGAASLAPGASVTCTASYTVTQADIDAGTITNTAIATGTPPSGPPLNSPPSTATVTATPNPALTVVKSVDATELTAAGQVLHYSFLVTNTGNVTLTNVTVNETAFSGTGTPPVVSCPAGAASLAPGAVVTCTASYTVTQADIDSGKVTNTATATGTPPSGPPVTSPPSSTSVPNTPAPALTVVKSALPATVTAVGQTVDYSFLVTNTGNVTLTNVSVNETAFSGTGTAPVISCPAGAASLAPGASVTCTASYTVTQADINAGSITNTATATGTPPSGPPVMSPPSTATVTAMPNPALTVVKSVDATELTAAGQVLHYSFLVTNTGNVTLTNVTVNETAFSGTGTAPVVSCPAGAASLAPGASVTCTASYTVTQADIDSGKVANTATATGTPPSGPPVTSPPSSTTVPKSPAPALTVVKSASPTKVTTVGETIDYSFLVTNTGNVTLMNVTVNETAFSGTGTPPVVSCPAAAASLAPGASVTCTAAYTVTQSDLNGGKITNTATATGTPPSGPPVTSPPSSASVTTEKKHGHLPSTGANGRLAGLAGGLLLLGGGLALVTRRLRRRG
ncbi:hypothetical protein AB0O91_15705 [Kitasatospora sp. NPDC089797]|uniref:DUF7507 domain-containing protein n=1 Tax=Kitasatospora sp. NPDC089797 TaxID=3155298 RepID=UPI0034462804